MFNLYDVDKSGSLDFSEVMAAAQASGFDQDEVLSLFQEADVNNDSTISFDEFVQLMRHSYI